MLPPFSGFPCLPAAINSSSRLHNLEKNIWQIISRSIFVRFWKIKKHYDQKIELFKLSTSASWPTWAIWKMFWQRKGEGVATPNLDVCDHIFVNMTFNYMDNKYHHLLTIDVRLCCIFGNQDEECLTNVRKIFCAKIKNKMEYEFYQSNWFQNEGLKFLCVQ